MQGLTNSKYPCILRVERLRDMNRQPLGNEICYESMSIYKVLELADVRRYQHKEKEHRPDVYPCQYPITVDEILDLYEMKKITVSMFGKPAGWKEIV